MNNTTSYFVITIHCLTLQPCLSVSVLPVPPSLPSLHLQLFIPLALTQLLNSFHPSSSALVKQLLRLLYSSSNHLFNFLLQLSTVLVLTTTQQLTLFHSSTLLFINELLLISIHFIHIPIHFASICTLESYRKELMR